MAAADEANPQSHPDALRRRRTLRDAGLAAKAATNFRSRTNRATADGAAADDGGSAAEEGEAPWIGRRVFGAEGGTQVVAPDHSTTRLSLGSR